MRKVYKSICRKACVLLMVALPMMFLGGCKEKEGPVEQAGKEIDKAIEQAGDAMKEAAEKLKEAPEK